MHPSAPTVIHVTSGDSVPPGVYLLYILAGILAGVAATATFMFMVWRRMVRALDRHIDGRADQAVQDALETRIGEYEKRSSKMAADLEEQGKQIAADRVLYASAVASIKNDLSTSVEALTKAVTAIGTKIDTVIQMGGPK